MEHERINNYIADLGLTYEATYLPKRFQMESRGTLGRAFPMLDWTVTLSKNGRQLSTEYHQGIGCIEGLPRNPKTVAEVEEVQRAIETGRFGRFANGFRRPLPKPLLRDVLYSLLSDADVLDYSDFESWARDCGYDADSRKAEAIYQACIKNALALRNLIGEGALASLKDIYQDY